jgi:hypothetical protein
MSRIVEEVQERQGYGEVLRIGICWEDDNAYSLAQRSVVTAAGLNVMTHGDTAHEGKGGGVLSSHAGEFVMLF